MTWALAVELIKVGLWPLAAVVLGWFFRRPLTSLFEGIRKVKAAGFELETDRQVVVDSLRLSAAGGDPSNRKALPPRGDVNHGSLAEVSTGDEDETIRCKWEIARRFLEADSKLSENVNDGLVFAWSILQDVVHSTATILGAGDRVDFDEALKVIQENWPEWPGLIRAAEALRTIRDDALGKVDVAYEANTFVRIFVHRMLAFAEKQRVKRRQGSLNLSPS